MNGYTKWLMGIFLTILIAFSGAMLRAGAVEYKVTDNKKVIDQQEVRIDNIEKIQARNEQHLLHIDQSLTEIMQLIKEHSQNVSNN